MEKRALSARSAHCAGPVDLTGFWCTGVHGITVQPTTHMVADGVVTSKLDSALVCEWPETIDLDKDIFIPTKVEQFKLSLVRALKSRGLWTVSDC